MSTSIAFLVSKEVAYIQESEDGSVSIFVHFFVSWLPKDAS